MKPLISIGLGQQLRLLLLFLAGIALTQQAVIDKGNFYTAGVVEFRDASDWRDNLAGYIEIINSPNASEPDIIVFPEATLNNLNSTSFVPKPEEHISPCLKDPTFTYYAEFLVQLSCAARNVSKYVVINLSERELCSDAPEDTRPCAPSGYNVYNTNVVFDRNGTVVSRYRKVHLWGEPRNTTFVPEVVSFKTDFNVTFGHIICFDIMFHKPGHELVVEQGVRNFIFPSMWFSQLPFLSAVQVQQAWAYSNNVNLLAAGSSHPELGSSGTGVYHGRDGAITSTMQVGDGQRLIYVAKVPKYEENSRMYAKSWEKQTTEYPKFQNTKNFKMKRDENLDNFETVSIDLINHQAEGSSVNEQVCHGNICCQFELEWRIIGHETPRNATYYNYRLGAYDGWRKEQSVDANYVRNCGIFACTGPEIGDCGVLIDELQPRVAFTHLLIESTFPKSEEFLIMPSSVMDNLMPLQPNEFEWSVEEKKDVNQVQVRFALADSVELENLLTFGIYGNYYDDTCTFGKGTHQQDLECGYKPKGDGAAALRFSSLSSFLLLTLSVVLAILFK